MKAKSGIILFFSLFLAAYLKGQTVNIGDILCTDGTTVSPTEFAASGRTAEGIVFYVDKNGQHGWAVNLHTDAVDTHWVDPSHYYDEYDIPELPNYEYSRQCLYDFDGYQNTAKIRAAHGADWYPAAWAVDFDHGWYLPAAGQMRWLIAYVNEVNASLTVVGGSPFVFPYPDWHWTSTERDGYHSIIVSKSGSVSNYMKWNYYDDYTIGVRSIKDFNCSSTAPLSIGDVVTAPGGQKGVVFYISPDDGSYWLAALNDLPQQYSWGSNQDIPNLDNQYDSWYALEGVYCGYDATKRIREAEESNNACAAHHVDLENGWHIPSVGQLSKLFAAMPHIEESLTQNGGTLPTNGFYWTSTENTSDKAWAIDFGNELYREGYMINHDKSSLHSVRPVWSQSCETPLPTPSLPDNIIETDCNQPIEGNDWNVELLYSTQNEDIASYAPLVAGDIDGNGVVDILISHFNGNNYRTNTLDIYSGADLSLQYRFNIQDSIYNTTGNYAICRYPKPDGSLQGAIFVHSYDRKIRSYSIDGTLLNVSDRATTCEGMVSFADFNGDGYPEVYAGSDIFDAATLKWLCSGPENGNKGESYRGSAPGVVNSHRCYYAMSLASNVLGDARQELICGNTIYDVNIVSRTNPALNSITVNKTITPPSGYSPDGHVSLADLDLDGECEVLVTRNDTDDHTISDVYFYAYKPSSGQILFQKTVHCLCTGYPLIGNIDNDPHPEIVFLEKQESWDPMYIYCWRYTTQTGFSTVWQYQHSDASGQTGITLFDFNQDDIMEIVYRDSDNLRIINGNTSSPHNLFSRRMAAGTGCEYPIVADINGDNHAEIVATGLLDQSANLPGYGAIHIFGSPDNWSPARPVWNQYMYHVINVNEDLTIPTYCFDKATVFTAPDGTVRRPYNNFLQQAYYINQYGEPYNPGGIVEIDIDGTGCNIFIFNDSTYTENGLYDQIIESPNGCDTIYHINVNLGEDISHEFWRVHCYSYTWNDSTYTESGIYQQTFHLPEGCDSTAIMHLQILDTIRHEWSQTVCNSYTWNGVTYTEPGDYVQHFEAEHGCDSIATLHLTFSDAMEFEADTIACGSFQWEGIEYLESGDYDRMFVTPGGCDSLIHMHLTIAPFPKDIPEIDGLTEVYVSTDLVVGQYFYSIDSVPFADHYEWILDGADWPMDTTGIHCGLWITTAGTATLTVRAWNDCGYSEQSIIIHAGFYDVDDFQDIPVALYPNPAKEKVVIESENILRIRLIDIQGQVLADIECKNSNTFSLDVANCASGIYIIEIITERGTARKKLDIRQ